ncbi:MAG TPA: AraC family transcriptional regulator [Chthoniobacteraceae bacterium]|nr:AraC family transcriptional regulator [Chthoniobacteraceae bacterium]
MRPSPPSILQETTHGYTLAGVHAGYVCWNPEPTLSALKHAGEEWAFPEYAVKPHQHRYPEFHLQLSGATRWIVDGVAHEVPAGTLIAVQAGVRHSWAASCQRAYHFIYASFDLATLLNELEPEEEPPLFGKSCWLCRDTARLQPLFQLLSQELSRRQRHRRRILRNTLESIALEIECQLATQVPPAPPASPPPDEEPGFHDPIASRAKRYIDQHLPEKLNVDSLAARLHISRSVLYQKMKRELGISPSAYQMQQRIEQSKAMLEIRTMSITSIALDLGFSSSQHFCTAFRKITGITPSAYRSGVREPVKPMAS